MSKIRLAFVVVLLAIASVASALAAYCAYIHLFPPIEPHDGEAGIGALLYGALALPFGLIGAVIGWPVGKLARVVAVTTCLVAATVIAAVRLN